MYYEVSNIGMVSESRVTAAKFEKLSKKEKVAYLKKYPKSKHGKGKQSPKKKVVSKKIQEKLGRIKKKYKKELDLVTAALKRAVESKDKEKIATVRKKLAHIMAQHKNNVVEANKGNKVSRIRGGAKTLSTSGMSTSSVTASFMQLFSRNVRGLTVKDNMQFNINLKTVGVAEMHDVFESLKQPVLNIGTGILEIRPEDFEGSLIVAKLPNGRRYTDKSLVSPTLWSRLITMPVKSIDLRSDDEPFYQGKFFGEVGKEERTMSYIVFDENTDTLSIYPNKTAFKHSSGIEWQEVMS